MSRWKAVCSCLAVVVSLTACGGSSDPSDPSPSNTTSLESQNKELVRRFYTEVIGQGNTSLAPELFAADYDPHDSSVPDGPDGQIKIVENLKTEIPGVVATIKHIGAQDDHVIVHWHASATPSNEASGKAVVDLYRVSGGKIAERWNGVQNVPAMTASGNSMFSDLYAHKQPKQEVTEEQEAANEQMVTTAYKGIFNDRSVAILEQHWDPNYIQHNPSVPTGRDALRDFIESAPEDGFNLEFFQTIADDDLVYTTSLPNPSQNDPASSHINTDIFRVADNKIVEHWDVIQELQ